MRWDDRSRTKLRKSSVYLRFEQTLGTEATVRMSPKTGRQWRTGAAWQQALRGELRWGSSDCWQ
jgi:hypothetical protein